LASRLTNRLTNRRSALVLVVLAAVVINLPIVHSTWYAWRLDRTGVETEATVVDTKRVPPDDDGKYVVEFRFDRTLDPEQRVWFAQVDEGTYDAARADETIGARMLPARPGTYEVDGQQQSSLPWIITLLGDVMLLGVALLYWRTRPSGEQLHLVATADVERCKPRTSIEQLEDGSYVVCGEVSGIEDDAIVLDLGDQSVRVELAGHANPVGYQQPARVTGRP
jgi:hypothetical protein